MPRNPLQTPKSRRAALAGGAALVMTAAVATVAAAQQTAAGATGTDAAAPTDLTAATDVVAATDAAATTSLGAIDMFAAAPESKDVFVFTSAAPPDLTQRRDDWLKAVAAKLGVSTDRLQQAIQDANKDVGLPPPLLTGPALGGAMPGTFGLKIMPPFAPAASALGITEDQLRKEQSAGKSLADIARAHNVDPKVVADAMKTQRRTELDRAVSDGVMPKDTADTIKSHIDAEVDHLMQAVPTVGANGAVNIQFQFRPGSTP